MWITPTKQVPTYAYSPLDKLFVYNFTKSLLIGVGRSPWALQRGELAIHFRKTLTDSEIAQLPQDWCALPAIDEAGDFEMIQQG